MGWGLGYDSMLMAELNVGGRTLFLEPNAWWVARSSASNLSYVTYHARTALNSSVARIREFLHSPHRATLRELDDGTCWDTILVDSPTGKWQHDPSRAVPIYTSRVDAEACAARGAYAAKGYATVWVHDCDRPGEDYLTHELLGPGFSETGDKKLREFRIQQPRGTKSSAQR